MRRLGFFSTPGCRLFLPWSPAQAMSGRSLCLEHLAPAQARSHGVGSGWGVPGALPPGTAAGGGNSHQGLTLLCSSLCPVGSLCQRRQKVRSSSNLDRVREQLPFWLCFLLRNRFFPLRMQKIDSLAGHIAEASHVQMVCTSAFFTALV